LAFEGQSHKKWFFLTPILLTLFPPSQRDWMIYRVPDLLAVIWFGSSPTLSHPRSPVIKLTLFLSLPACRRSSLFMWEEGGDYVVEPNQRRRESLVIYKSFILSAPSSFLVRFFCMFDS
jgi:hypothetical protein